MQILKKLLAAAILIAILYFGIWPFIGAGDRMESFCSNVPMGMAQPEFYRYVKEQSKYQIVESKEYGMFRVLVVDAKAMGRYVCEVIMEEGKTAKAKYVFNN